MRPPRSEAELMSRARGLAGRTIGQLAAGLGMQVPENTRRAKGWVGQLLEHTLGATAGSKSVPDFERIGVEMKTIPINARGGPSESTYVCTAWLKELVGLTWETSRVRKKLARVLWVPVQADKAVALVDRRVGSPLLWSPDAEEEELLRGDWEELTDLIRLGQVEEITARMGTVLQIRPKAADSRATTWGVDETGHRFKTLPRGFYLRARFTAEVLRRSFVMPGDTHRS